MLRHFRRLVGLGVMALALGACASNPNKPVSIDSRPSPGEHGSVDSAARPGTQTPLPTRTSSVAADTLAARSAMRRCAGRKLMPEQESTLEAMEDLLAHVRSALASSDATGAASYARQAKQLGSSLGCP